MGCSEIAGNCRACQTKTQEESPKIFIFNSVKLPDIFKETTSLDIQENDELPKVLCCSCYDRLLEAYNFRKMCSAAALQFQKILSMDVPEEKYTPLENQSNAHALDTTLMDIKIESDSDDPSSPLRNDQNHVPDDADNATSDISDTISIGEKVLDAIKAEPDDEDSLISHVNKDRGLIIPEEPTKLECGICNSSFHQKSRLEMHIWTQHLTLKPRKCKICGEEFKSSSSLSNHLRTHENTKEFESQNETNPHVCVICGVGKATEEELSDHIITHRKNKKWLCVYCAFKTIKRFNLTRHVKTVHHGEKDSRTSQSEGSFSTEAIPRNSMERHEVIKKQVTVSRVSSSKTATGSGLNSRMTANAKKKHITCELCSLKFSRRGNLTQHVKIVHHGIKNHHCTVCKKSFGTSKSLKNHFMLHTGERPHACTKCPKRFIALDKLKMHIKTHTRENILSCESCSFTTTCNYRMKRHIKSVHERTKDYQCPHCDRSFVALTALKSHVLTHCNECGMRFAQRSNLMIHLKTHLESMSKA